MEPPDKLFMVLLGSKAKARNVEQHDFFFGIGKSLKELVPAMKAFWPEAAGSLHIDGWRTISSVDGYRIQIVPKDTEVNQKRLFFVNLGGYTSGILEEQHYAILSVQDDRASALSVSKKTKFFKTATIPKVKGAAAHIDEKYGVDVDDTYRIEELLSDAEKARYRIALVPDEHIEADEIHLGYLQLHKL